MSDDIEPAEVPAPRRPVGALAAAGTLVESWPPGQAAWRRRRLASFRGPRTRAQCVCDLFVCVLVPALLFQARFVRDQLVPEQAWAAAHALATVAAAAALCFHLVPRARARPELSGALWTACVAATLVGLGLLPFSLIGLAALIGLLGFAPFVAAWSFARCGAQAWRAARERGASGVRRTLRAVAGSTLLLAAASGLLAGARYAEDRATQQVLAGTPREARRGVRMLRVLGMWPGLTHGELQSVAERDLAAAASNPESPERRARAAWRALTGLRYRAWLDRWDD